MGVTLPGMIREFSNDPEVNEAQAETAEALLSRMNRPTLSASRPFLSNALHLLFPSSSARTSLASLSQYGRSVDRHSAAGIVLADMAEDRRARSFRHAGVTRKDSAGASTLEFRQ